MKFENLSFLKNIKFYSVITLVVVASFLLTSQILNSYHNRDFTSQYLINEVEETVADTESTIPDVDFEYFFKALILVFSCNLVINTYSCKKTVNRLTFLHHIRPRSPPAI